MHSKLGLHSCACRPLLTVIIILQYPMITKNAFNSGDDVAGIVESAGEKAVKSFKKGDKSVTIVPPMAAELV